MGKILVRNINEDALKAWRAKAQLKGQSLESIVRELNDAEGTPNLKALLEGMRDIRVMTPGKVPSLAPSDYREGLE